MAPVTYNAVVRDYNLAASSSIVGRLLLPDLTQVPSSWKIEFRGKVLERTVDLSELMCSPQEPIQLRKPMIKKPDSVYLSTMSGKIMELPFVSMDTTVGALKTWIRLIEGMNQGSQGLIWSGQSLEDDNRTLKNYGVQNSSPIQLVLRVNRDDVTQSFQPAAAPFDIFIKTLSGTTLRVKVSSEDTVDILKSKIQDINRVTADRQRVIYAGYLLMDGNILKNYGIGNGSTLHFVEDLRGGIGRLEGYKIGDRDYLWAGYLPGLNLLGVCSKVTCTSNLRQEPVIINEKYGAFKMTPSRYRFPCLACPCSSDYTGERGLLRAPNFLVNSARSLFRFKKSGYDQPVKVVLKESLGRFVDYTRFDASAENAEHDFVEVTTVGVDSSPYFCVICDTSCISENAGSVRSERILSCGHAYHRECAPGEVEECGVCGAQLFENMAELLGGDEEKKMLK